MNDVKFYLDAAEKKMQEAVDFLDDTLAHIRAGKANVKILDGIRVNYYGSPVPIDNVANVSTPDQRTIAIMPWERTMIGTIEKAIIPLMPLYILTMMCEMSASGKMAVVMGSGVKVILTTSPNSLNQFLRVSPLM